TQVGVTMGTPLYMSPEQVEGKPLDSRSDLYSLGVTCYYLLTRKNPFDGESPLAVAVKHLQHTPPQLANLRPDLPKRLCQLIHKMLAKQIDQRPTTAEIFEELQQLQQEHPIVPLSQTPSSITTPFAAFHSEPLSATRQLQRSLAGQTTSTYPSRFALILSGLFLLGAIGIGLFLATSSRPGDPLALAPGKVPGIEKLATAKQQFDAAFWNPNREEAYKSILDYFPEDGTAQTTLYRLRAKHELAEYYLRNGPADLAKRYYTELTMANEQEWPEYPAIGYCRLVLIYHGENNTEKTLQYLPKAETLQGKLTDVDLQRALEDVINDHRNQRDGGG
ncbi:MAG: protein kinase, partial [Pirellulaceae bacterium]|nr:protein kinase [Pirellulaceae bacterium]